MIESNAAQSLCRDVLCFGPFRLFPQQRRLERDGTNLPIGGRALDILTRLVEGGGAIVSKQDLYAAAWPGMVVEDGALRFHIASLRKTLDAQGGQGSFLKTVAGRGYSLSAAVTAPAAPAHWLGAYPLPARPRGMVGRDTALAGARDELVARPLLTLVGPAGIGKTMLATHLAHDLAGHFEDGVAFADLSTVAGDPFVFFAGIRDAALRQAATDRRRLLVLDGCEHVIDRLAPLAEDLLANRPDLTILATSREALRIEGEAVYRLFPLPCPPLGSELAYDEVLCWPAARLLVERLQAVSVTSHPGASDVPFLAIAEIYDGGSQSAAARIGDVGLQIVRDWGLLFNAHGPGRTASSPSRPAKAVAALPCPEDLLDPAQRAMD